MKLFSKSNAYDAKNFYVSTIHLIFLFFNALMFYGYFVSYTSGTGLFSLSSDVEFDPYRIYYDHPVVRRIYLVAWGLNFSLMIVAFLKLFCPLKPRVAGFEIAALCVGFILPWFEIYYGTTFYYGEVRDKQGLPFAVNNFGLIGSCIFACYLCSETTVFNFFSEFIGRRKYIVILAVVAVHAVAFVILK